MASLTIWAVLTMRRVFDPSRRRMLALAALAAAALVLSAAFGIRQAREPLLVEVDIPVRGLPKDLDGVRIAQLTDIHYGPFFGRADLERAIARLQERPDWLERCMQAMAMTLPKAQMWSHIRALRRGLAQG